MASRLPLIQPGDAIRASYLNRITGVINDEVLNAPRDLDQGADPDEAASVIMRESSRTAETVRIYQDGDAESENYVDVDRPISVIMVNDSTGETWQLIFNNSSG